MSKLKIKSSPILLWILLFLFSSNPGFSWGFWAHKRINRAAVFCLPNNSCFDFFKNNLDYLTNNAPAPDLRRNSDPLEAPRHFIDLDIYCSGHDCDTFPHTWAMATKKYSVDTIKKYGYVPFQIVFSYRKLVESMKNKDKDNILHYAADLGHYVGDACVPLHSTKNYDGQLSGQKGIHALWESKVPELMSNQFHFYAGKAHLIDSVQGMAWTLVNGSFNALDSVLAVEKSVSKDFSEDKKYVVKQRGKSNKKDYSDEFITAYGKELNPQIQRRLLTATNALGSFWYTAWAEAGQPDLSTLIDPKVAKEMKKKLKKEQKSLKKGNWDYTETISVKE